MILFKIIPIFFIIVGAFYAVFPKVGWELRRFSYGSPSPITLLFIRVIGVFCMIIGFVFLNSFSNIGP